MNEHRPSDAASPRAFDLAPSRLPVRRAVSKGSSHEGLTPLFVLHAVRRWWKVAAPLGILLAVAAAGTVFLLFEPQYLAIGRIRILGQQPHIAFPTEGSSNSSKQFVQTQLQLLRLPVVLLPVLADPKVQRHPEILEARDQLAYLTEAVQVKAIGDSEIYSIEYEASDPQRAKEVVDAVIASYMRYVATYDSEFRHKLSNALGLEIEKQKAATQLKWKQLQDLSQSTGVSPTPSSPTLSGLAMGDPLSDMRAMQVQAEADIIMLTAAIETEKGMANAPIEVTDADIERIIGADVLVRKKELDARREQLEKLKAQATSQNNPTLQHQLAILKADEEKFARDEQQLRAQTRVQLSSGVTQQFEARLGELEWKLSTAKATQEIVKKKIEEEEARGGISMGDQLKVDYANRELLQAENVSNVLLQQQARLSTEANAPSRVFALDGAEGVRLPEAPDKQLPILEMLLALGVAFCCPFALAVGWEWTVKRVNTVDEIRYKVGMPILGEIASLPVYGYGRRASKRSSLSRQLFEESVDGLRTNIVLAESMRHVQVLAIASAVSSEGKTSVATHLAMSLARTSGKPILLIDGDMRAPDIHHMFDVVLDPGLAEVLNGDCHLDDAIVQSDFPLLSLLPAGELAANPHRLLHNGTFRSLLDELRKQYDYIVIDTPPVLAASEALVLAKHADATVVCAMRDRTRMNHIQQAYTRLEAAGANTVGVVMSGLPVRSYASRYGSYTYGKSYQPL